MFLQLSLTFAKKHDPTDFFFSKVVAAETMATTIKKMSILGGVVCVVLGRRGVCVLFLGGVVCVC